VGPESPIGLRASDADRESTVGRLRVAAMEGRLDADELAQRVSAAYQAKWCAELDRLVADVTPAPVAAPVGPPQFVRSVSRTNGFAIASLVFACLWMAWMGSLAAVVSGHVALSQIRARGQAGKGLAVAGLTIGYLQLLVLAVALLYVS
jgi:Domain of unknown function (DUF4190)/Domain of unknown function (DUF1707)